MKNETKDKIVTHLADIEPFIENTSDWLNDCFDFCTLYDLACIYEGIIENKSKCIEYHERQETLSALLAEVVTTHQEFDPDFTHDSNYSNVDYTEGVHSETHIDERERLFNASIKLSAHAVYHLLLTHINEADRHLEKIAETGVVS